ncbi:MAG: 3-phosphoshikimate 1-carboxyvinyltransferase [Actinomycetota bacterium]
MTDRTVTNPGGPFRASVQVPGDKSLSHRALILAAMAEGDSLVNNIGPGQDVRATVAACRQLGVTVDLPQVRSPGIRQWSTPSGPIDCANSGTTMRLLAGALSTAPISATLAGDPSLSSRPMARLTAPLRALGGVIETAPEGTAPLRVGGVSSVRTADVRIEVASAQVRSAFELAALAADGPSTIDSPPGFRDHTERWLSAIGRGEWGEGSIFAIHPGPVPPARYDIPGDPSSAAFLWALAAIEPGSEVLTPNVSLNPGRLGFLQILEKMGAGIEAAVTDSVGGDPVGDVIVRAQSLEGTAIGGHLVAAALDELPLVAVVAAFAEGVTTVRDATELRAKESDRIESTTQMLRSLGGGIEDSADGFSVVGTGFLNGGAIDSRGDHRIAMAGAVAGMRAQGPVTIENAQAAAVSWPGFYETLEELWS